MESINQAIVSSSVSNEDDRFLFEERSPLILPIKYNNHEVTSLELNYVSAWGETAWRRLGEILGRTSMLTYLQLWRVSNLDVVALCNGLKHNKHIKEIAFQYINLKNTINMTNLAPFLSNNPSLKKIIFKGCRIGSSHFDLVTGYSNVGILSNALMKRPMNTLEHIDLSKNHFCDIELDIFAGVLQKCEQLKCVLLSNNVVRRRGCTTLGNLLGYEGSSLVELYLDDNPLDNDCALLLAKSLAKNNTLKRLYLGSENGITAFGWSVLLKLLCDTTSMKHISELSNHTICDLGIHPYTQRHRRMLITALGVDDFHLLSASLDLNAKSDKNWVVRQKIILGHAKGDLEIAKSSIPNGAMPEILSWLGNFVIETHPLSISRIFGLVRIESIYRIIKVRPDLCG